MHKCRSRVRKSVKRERGWRDAKISFWPLRNLSKASKERWQLKFILKNFRIRVFS